MGCKEIGARQCLAGSASYPSRRFPHTGRLGAAPRGLAATIMDSPSILTLSTTAVPSPGPSLAHSSACGGAPFSRCFLLVEKQTIRGARRRC